MRGWREDYGARNQPSRVLVWCFGVRGRAGIPDRLEIAPKRPWKGGQGTAVSSRLRRVALSANTGHPQQTQNSVPCKRTAAWSRSVGNVGRRKKWEKGDRCPGYEDPNWLGFSKTADSRQQTVCRPSFRLPHSPQHGSGQGGAAFFCGARAACTRRSRTRSTPQPR